MGSTRLWSWGPAEFGCWMGGTRLRSWGPAVLDGWHVAQELGVGGMWIWSWGPAEFGGHTAWELGARGVWMGGTRLGAGARGFGWLARGSGAGGPQMDRRHAALELVRGVWMGGTRLRSWGPWGGTRLRSWGPVWMGGTRLGSPVLLPALVPPDFTKQTLLVHRSNVAATRAPACRERRQMPVKWLALQSLAQTRTGFQLDDAAHALAMTSCHSLRRLRKGICGV
eukprot:s4895_g1.t1